MNSRMRAHRTYGIRRRRNLSLRPLPQRGALVAACVVLAALAVACGGGSSDPPVETAAPPSTDPLVTEADDTLRIVCLGDSLTAGYGLAQSDAYPALLQERLRAAGYPHEVVNAGVSGDTSAGGLRRLDWSLRGNVQVLVLALGANDGLRGLPATDLSRNLTAMIQRAKSRGVAVLLAGMEAPPNFGPAYTRQFRQVYAEVARAEQVRFVPFFLDGVAGQPALNQADGIHPNARGQRMIADLLWREIEPMLESRQTQ
jgi:acyl-CoA thioesterase-1